VPSAVNGIKLRKCVIADSAADRECIGFQVDSYAEDRWMLLQDHNPTLLAG